MKRAQEIAAEEEAMAMLSQLTNIFESIASMRIAQVKNQVLHSQQFFQELWNIYSQIRVDSSFHFGQSGQQPEEIINKELLIVITAEGAFSGDIDQKLIHLLLSNYNPAKHDIVVIGHHGAVQLAQAGIAFIKYYKMPAKDNDINVTPIVQLLQKYKSATVYYQTYVTLMVQDVKRIALSSVVQNLSQNAKPGEEVISEQTYIFEPSTYDVVDHLERSMMHIALSQLILDSKLAQYASRFRAMSAAHTKAVDSRDELHRAFNRAKRAAKDERLKEIMNGLRKAHA